MIDGYDGQKKTERVKESRDEKSYCELIDFETSKTDVEEMVPIQLEASHRYTVSILVIIVE